MSIAALVAKASQSFEKSFGEAPIETAFAPGRVNLLGEHTDYNGGFVLPMPLALGTAVAIGFGGTPGTMVAVSDSFDTSETRQLSEPANGSWTDYILGSILQILDGRIPATGIRLTVSTNLPVGSGLSSSAALEIATMRAASKLMNITIDPVEMAKLARRAENEFVGMPCGIMDQYSVSVGDPGAAVFLDTRRLKSRVISLPKTHNFVVVHSGQGHKHTDNGYEQRVAECNQACKLLGVDVLSDIGLEDLLRIADLPAPIDGRARHIITENDRVLRAVDALAANDLTKFALLMIESHNSQRDDYDVSLPEIDALVQGALDAGAAGARLTGGGFGGSIVALVEANTVKTWCEEITQQFPDARVIAVT